MKLVPTLEKMFVEKPLEQTVYPEYVLYCDNKGLTVENGIILDMQYMRFICDKSK